MQDVEAVTIRAWLQIHEQRPRGRQAAVPRAGVGPALLGQDAPQPGELRLGRPVAERVAHRPG